MKAIILALLLAACSTPSDWWEGEQIDISARTDSFSAPVQATFRVMVQEAIDEWNAGMTAIGCPAPFKLNNNSAHVVTLIDGWEWPEKYEGAGGVFTYEGIIIRRNLIAVDGDAGIPYRVTPHELGHALGLGHAKRAYGPSLMYEEDLEVWTLQPRDFAQAACEIGCGPCEHDNEWEGEL